MLCHVTLYNFLKICVEVQIKVDSQKVVYVWVNYVGFLDINKTVYLIFIVSYIYAMYYEHTFPLPYPIPLPILQVSLCVWMFYLHVYMCAMWVQWHGGHETPLDPIEVKVQRFGAITYVLGTKVRFSAKAASALSLRTIVYIPSFSYFLYCLLSTVFLIFSCLLSHCYGVSVISLVM